MNLFYGFPVGLILFVVLTDGAIVPNEKPEDIAEDLENTVLSPDPYAVDIANITDYIYGEKYDVMEEVEKPAQEGIKANQEDVPIGFSCHEELGLSSVLSSTLISTSSGDPESLRLDSPDFWTVNGTERDPWAKVEFDSEKIIMGFIVRHDLSQGARLAEFYVVWGGECNSLINSSIKNHHKVFEVPYDPESNRPSDITVFVDEPFVTKCLLILPTVDSDEEEPLALQVELLGCGSVECTESLLTDIIPWANGVGVNFGSEKLITNITFHLDHNSSVANLTETIEVLTSRTCRTFYSTSGLESVIPTFPNSRRIVLTFTSPVRLQCIRLNITTNWTQEPAADQRKANAAGCDIWGEPSDLCGRSFSDHLHTRRRQKRIIGGQPLSRSIYPWLVSLQYNGFHSFKNFTPHNFSHLCGASLIHPSWVLTAAHCFAYKPKGLRRIENWSAALGEHTLLSLEDTTEIYPIEKYFTHPNFQGKVPIANDIALLKLKEPVPMSSYARTVCLEETGGISEGTPCSVSGWGAIRGDARTGANNVPLEVGLPIINLDVCRYSYYNISDDHPAKGWTAINESVVCAAYKEGGRDSCPGDSGGPLSCYDGEKWVQVGVTSGGFMCGIQEYPGVYTNVFHFLDWIREHIADN